MTKSRVERVWLLKYAGSAVYRNQCETVITGFGHGAVPDMAEKVIDAVTICLLLCLIK